MDKLMEDLGETEPMDRLRVGELKKMDKSNQQEFLSRQKEINASIRTVSSGKMLPERTLLRYDARFSKKNEKKALLFALCAFIVAFAFAFFIQPSIFFQYYADKVYLVNLSDREITNVSIFPVTQFAEIERIENSGEGIFVEKLKPKGVVNIPDGYKGLFVALADRQLPAIGFIAGQSEGLGSSVYQGLIEQTEQ